MTKHDLSQTENKPKLAWDSLDLKNLHKVSVREIDGNGFLHVKISPITREQVAPYYGNEIPNWERLGLEPKKIYYGYRPAEELQKEATLKSTNGIPIHLMHHDDYAIAPVKNSRVGSTGTDAEWRPPFLTNSLHITDQNAIDRINDGSMRELSLAYRYVPDFTAGTTPDGEKYDFVMREISANHLALVDEGRAGRQVSVWDRNSISSTTKEDSHMDEKQEALAKLIADLLTQAGKTPEEIEALQPQVLSLIENGPAPVEADEGIEPAPEEKKKEDDANVGEAPAEAPAEEPAGDEGDTDLAEKMTADAGPDEAMLARIREAGLDADNPEVVKAYLAGLEAMSAVDEKPQETPEAPAPEAKDEEPEAKGEGEKIDPETKEEIVKEVTKEINDKYLAVDECKASLGNTKPGAYDCAGSVYLEALKQEGFKLQGVTKANAQAVYRAFMHGRTASVMAQDSAPKKEGVLENLFNSITQGY